MAVVSSVNGLTRAGCSASMIFGLRQARGVDLDEARKNWGEDLFNRWRGKIETLARDGLLTRSGDHLRLAETAYLVSNEVFQEFV